MVEFLYDYFRDSRKDTSAPADLPRRGGVRRLPDFQRRWFFRQSLETLGRTVPYGRAIIWLTQQDPAYTRGYAEELNEYLERSNFGWIKEQREIGDWLTGRNWSVVKDVVGDFGWTFEVAYNRQGVPKSGAISCHNPSVPDDIGFGSAVSYWGECPGGACDGTYINVPGSLIGKAVQTFKVPTMKHSGGGWYVAGSAMFGPMAPAGYPRFGLKTKVCGPGLFQSWDRTPGKIYYAIATREITKTVVPVGHSLEPPPIVASQSVHGPRSLPRYAKGKLRLPKRYQLPALTVEAQPDGRYKGPVRNFHDVLPPPPGERQKKGSLALKQALALVARLYDGTTEANDIVKIAYDALDKKHQCKGARGMAAKANCVWNNLDHLNLDKFIHDLIVNHFEDKVAGWFFSHSKKAPYGVALSNKPRPPAWVFKG